MVESMNASLGVVACAGEAGLVCVLGPAGIGMDA